MHTKFILFFSGKIFQRALGLIIAAISFSVNILLAQDTSSAHGEMEATIQLSFHKNADLSKTAIAIVTALKNDKKVFATNAVVNFYIQTNSGQQLLKKVFTDRKGTASVSLPTDLPLDADRHFTITAKIENDSLYENSEEEITNAEANLSIQLQEKDTTKSVSAIVTTVSSDGLKPVKGIEVKFYVQRLFGVLPLGDDNAVTTDDDGRATIDFPQDIPGDTAGNLIIVARIDDDDNYGTLESKTTAKWGLPLVLDKDPFPRALWEPYAPPSLILVICILFGGVWCTYFYTFYQLRKIKRDKPDTVTRP